MRLCEKAGRVLHENFMQAEARTEPAFMFCLTHSKELSGSAHFCE